MLLQKVFDPIVPELNTSNHAYLNPNIHEFGQVHKLEHHELSNYATLIMSQQKNGPHIKPCMMRANGSNIMGLCVKFLILETWLLLLKNQVHIGLFHILNSCFRFTHILQH